MTDLHEMAKQHKRNNESIFSLPITVTKVFTVFVKAKNKEEAIWIAERYERDNVLSPRSWPTTDNTHAVKRVRLDYCNTEFDDAQIWKEGE